MTVLVLLTGLTALASAQSVRYVTDTLKLEARSGPSRTHRIVRMLPTGTRVRVLETSSEGYSRVKPDKGSEVWILTRYLRDDPPVRDQLTNAKSALKRATSELQAVKAKLDESTSAASRVSSDKEQLAAENEQLRGELQDIQQAAAATLSIRNTNQSLKSRVSQLEQDLERTQRENSVLRSSREQEWFVAGAGVLIGGAILGLIIPKIRWKRRRSWGEL